MRLDPARTAALAACCIFASGPGTRTRPEENPDLESVRRDYIGRLAWPAEDRPRFDLLLSRLELDQADRLDSVEDRSRPGRPVECLSCHDPHGTAFPQFLLGGSAAELCTRCHAAG